MKALALGWALAVLAAVLTIGGVWWWALAGMTPDVGTALMVTVYVVGAASVAAFLKAAS